MLMVPLWFIYVNPVFLNCLATLEAPVFIWEVHTAENNKQHQYLKLVDWYTCSMYLWFGA